MLCILIKINTRRERHRTIKIKETKYLISSSDICSSYVEKKAMQNMHILTTRNYKLKSKIILRFYIIIDDRTRSSIQFFKKQHIKIDEWENRWVIKERKRDTCTARREGAGQDWICGVHLAKQWVPLSHTLFSMRAHIWEKAPSKTHFLNFKHSQICPSKIQYIIFSHHLGRYVNLMFQIPIYYSFFFFFFVLLYFSSLFFYFQILQSHPLTLNSLLLLLPNNFHCVQ